MSASLRLSTDEKNAGACEAREDGIHCVHWWDGEEDATGNEVYVPCCGCGWNGGAPPPGGDHCKQIGAFRKPGHA